VAHITRITQHELPIIAELAHRIWPHSYGDILTPEQISNLLQHIYSPSNLESEMRGGHFFWLAHEENAPVGFASAYREADIVWLRKLYVLPEMQGRGIGKALVAQVLAAFPAGRELRLLVNKNNVRAQEFYVQSGFRCTEEVPVKMGDHMFIDRIYARAI